MRRDGDERVVDICTLWKGCMIKRWSSGIEQIMLVLESNSRYRQGDCDITTSKMRHIRANTGHKIQEESNARRGHE
jgi:hypothetical protein